MAIPWNEHDPRDAALIVQNITNVLRQAARQAHLRHPPSVSMAQEWHRQIYLGVRLPDEAQLRSVLTLWPMPMESGSVSIRSPTETDHPSLGELVRPALRRATLREIEAQARGKPLRHGFGAFDARGSSGNGCGLRPNARPSSE